MLRGRGLGFRYNGAPVDLFMGLDIDVAAGEVVALFSPSGQGKTTLARILAGYLRPTTGTVTVDGEALDTISGFCPVQLIFQHPETAVNPRWTMGRTLAESGRTQGDVVTALGIESEWLNRFPNEVSGGELQRFCVARALTPQTRYLIADEMTTMLDALTQAHIWQVVLDWAADRRVGILVVSHEKALVDRICHRVVEMPGSPTGRLDR